MDGIPSPDNQLTSSGNGVAGVTGITILDNIPAATYICNASGYITAYNKAAASLWAMQPVPGQDQWFPSRKLFSLNHQDLPASLSPMARAAEQGAVVEQVIYMENAHGSHIKLNAYCAPDFGDAGNFSGLVVTLNHIPEDILADEKQAILAAIVDSSDDTILSKTLGGIITSWNKAAERMFGYSQHEAVGKHISILIPPSRLNEEEYIIGQIAQGNRVEHFETIRVTKEGKYIPISLSVSPLKDSAGNIIGASKIARDISIQKQAEEAAASYTRRLEVINAVTVAISEELDLNKILQKVTDATTELTGAQFGAFFYNKVEDNGQSYMLYTLSGVSKEVFKGFPMPRNTTVFDHTFSGLGVVRVADITQDPRYGKNAPHSGMPKGHLPVVSYLAVPVVSRSGAVIGGLFFGHAEAGKFTAEHEDIVIPIAAQAAIGLDNAKLYEEIKFLNERKDEFIGLASHELKTPLTSISGYMQILDRLKTGDKDHKFVTKTIQQVKKLNALVSDLLDVSKIEAGKLQFSSERFDIAEVLNDAIELIQHSNNSHHITLHTGIDSLAVYGDPHRIEQVIINLLTNAIKYSHMANRVEVSLTATGNEVKVAVKDFGMGIPKDKFQQLFSRFYRVEELNPHVSGLGIGLYISHEIISRHNGKLWVESELGKGSTFWFTLPLTTDKA